MNYSGLIYSIKTDHENVWEFIEENEKKYNEHQWNGLFFILLESSYKEIICNGNDNFTWELIIDDLVRFMKKNTDVNIDILNYLYDVCIEKPLDFINHTTIINIGKYSAMFEALCLAINCNCTSSEITNIYNGLVSKLYEMEE